MEVVTSTLIYLVFPLVGLKCYLWLCQRMKDNGVASPPIWAYFILFFTYGGLIQIILTKLFWVWSGLATLGLAYLLFIAPFFLFITAILLFPNRKISRLHQMAYITSLSYLIFTGFVWGGMMVLKMVKP
jgi:hypothetical protein